MVKKKNEDGIHVMVGGLCNQTVRHPTEPELYILSMFDIENMWRLGNETENLSGKTSSRTGDKDFTGTDTWEEAVGLSENGWPEGLRQIDEILSQIHGADNMVHGEAQDKRFRAAGSRVSVPKALMGMKNCMLKKKRVETMDGNHIKIAVNVSASCGTPEASIRTRGAAVCALVMKLEQEGYAVELIAFGINKNGGAKCITHLPVKRPEDVLDKERVAFALSHASTMRRGMFAIWERLPQGIFERCMGYSYGRPKNITDEEKNIMGYSMVLPKISHGGDEDGVDWENADPWQLALWVEKKWQEAITSFSDKND